VRSTPKVKRNITQKHSNVEKYTESEEEYYAKAFKRLDETGKRTWNWAAFLFGHAWMFYRKMYLYGFLFFMASGILQNCIPGITAFIVCDESSNVSILENDYPITYWSVMCCSEILVRVLMGYFGNSMYYSAVKKKIRKGYHLLDKYCPTSIPSILCWPVICFADWISRKLQLKVRGKNKTNEETVRAYLNSDKEIHWVVRVANVIACLAVIAVIATRLISARF